MANEASSAAEKPKTNGDRRSGNLRGEGSYLPDIHRLLPQSPDAEMGLLGSILLMPREVVGECVEGGIQEGHFHIPAHAVIYNAVLDLWNTNQPIDIITLTQILRDRNKLDEAGGVALVSSLMTFVPTAANASYYMEIMQEKHTLRSIIRTCTEYAARSYDEQENVPMLLDEVEQKIFEIAQERYKEKEHSLAEQVMDAIEAIEKLYERRGTVSGLETGFSELDKMTNGLHPAEMIVIAARPSMGKTALAMNIAEHVALKVQKPVAIFSLEMSTQQLIQRLLCSAARVNLQRVRDGFLNNDDFRNLQNAAARLAAAKIYIDDSAGLSIVELRAKARRLKSQHDIQLIVIDYLQLLRSTTRRASENRQIEIAEISSGIKALSKELEVPIIVLAQLNRNPENRTGESKGRPRLSDLRESGSIEQDADLVGLLVREEYYAEDEESKKEAEGKAELIIAKQRNGPVGDVALTFLKEYTRFEDRARVAEPE
ncbi:MAG TPA: replicative DNA helicase [Chthoniobacteraceae bacterium]|nr:replicative DNA helicase [Chthoniobacteraceae bacterium]